MLWNQYVILDFLFLFIIVFSFLPKDADNEMITFSSDEELVEALGSFHGDVFRVYVKNIEDDQDASQFDGGYSAVIEGSKTLYVLNIREFFQFLRCHDLFYAK